MEIKPAPYTLSRATFIKTFGVVYEHSPWVAERLYDQGIGPSDSDPAIIALLMAKIVDVAGIEQQRMLLRAHPELAGKLAVARSLTAESAAEQSSAQLDQCSAEEFATFQALNQHYHETFGHPFIIAVRGLDRAAILSAFQKRVKHSPDAEFSTALAEVHKIARLRLNQLAAV